MGDMFRRDLGHLQALVKIQILKKLLKCNLGSQLLTSLLL